MWVVLTQILRGLALRTCVAPKGGRNRGKLRILTNTRWCCEERCASSTGTARWMLRRGRQSSRMEENGSATPLHLQEARNTSPSVCQHSRRIRSAATHDDMRGHTRFTIKSLQVI